MHKQIEKEKKALEIEELNQKIAVEKEKKALEIVKVKQNIIVQKQMGKKKKALEIARLSEALEMAKRMGIKNNNFDKPDNSTFPLWFRYGELALQQEIRSLRSKEERNPQKLIYKKTQAAKASTGNQQFKV